MSLSTFYGQRLAISSVARPFPIDPSTALAEAAFLDRVADLHLAEGRGMQADRLSHLALELRCWAHRRRA